MKRRFKIVVITAVILLLCGATVLATNGALKHESGAEYQAEENEGLRKHGIEIEDKYLTDEPEAVDRSMLKEGDILFKGNSQSGMDPANPASEQKYVDPVDLDLLRVDDAQLVENRVMRYDEYLDQYDGERGALTMIASDRLVRVVVIHYPDGYETIRGGFFKNATVTGLYDAETGYYFGQYVSGDRVAENSSNEFVGPRG